MLQRQQAEATIDARTKIVDTLSKVAIDATVKIDGSKNQYDHKLAGNLLLVMLSDKPVQPVIDLKNNQ